MSVGCWVITGMLGGAREQIFQQQNQHNVAFLRSIIIYDNFNPSPLPLTVTVAGALVTAVEGANSGLLATQAQLPESLPTADAIARELETWGGFAWPNVDCWMNILDDVTMMSLL